jgi:HEAT repeat protein
MSKPAVTLDEILAMFSDKSFKVRRNAVNMLGKYKTYRDDPRIMPALIKATKDKTLGVTQAAMRVLSKRGDLQGLEALPNILKRPHSCSFERKITKFVTSYGQAAVPYLVAQMDNPKPVARRRVLQLLTELEAPEAFDTAIKALGDPDHTVQECAIYRLADSGDKRALEPLLEIMHGDDFDLPATAVRAIGLFLRAEAVEYLLPMLQHRAAKVRQAAVETLAAWVIFDPLVGAAVARLFNDKNGEVRISVLRFFERRPYPSARSLLINELADAEERVRSIAVSALGALGVRDSEIGEAMRQALPKEPEQYIRSGIVYHMGDLFNADDIPLLEAVLEKTHSEADQSGSYGAVYRLNTKDHLIKLLETKLQQLRGDINQQAAQAEVKPATPVAEPA